MKRFALLTLLVAIISACGQKMGKNEMDIYISKLMGQMTIEEKIGQLNLLTPGGGIPTGAAVSTDVEAKIKEGMWAVFLA